MADDNSSKSGAAGESDYQRNLPAVIEPKRESWLGRTLRTLFGWRATTLRADLSEFLDEAPAAETGFSPDESRMLKNILGLRERRLQDVMVGYGYRPLRAATSSCATTSDPPAARTGSCPPHGPPP